MNLNDHIKEIEKEFDEFGFIDKLTQRMDQDADTPSELRHFLSSKLREIATATLAACDKEWEQWLSDRKEELETYAEWLDTRLMNGDWSEKTEFKNEEEVRMKIGKNLCQAEQIDEVIAAVEAQKKEAEEWMI